jgi:hypothetical protein
VAVADGVDGAMDQVKAAALEAGPDSAAPEADLLQLRPRDDPVLACRQRGGRLVAVP